MTINQSLIIHKLPKLFSILNELKSNLNFKIEYVNDHDFTNISKKNNVVVISGDKKSNLQNQVKIEEYPINIQKLIENINIQFLKNKFNQQNNVKVGKYHINLNSRVMILESKSLQLTEKEVKIISFLNDSDFPISINKLQSEVWGYKSKLETHTVETHIYRLRKKILKKFKNDNFIISEKDGYKINLN